MLLVGLGRLLWGVEIRVVRLLKALRHELPVTPTGRLDLVCCISSQTVTSIVEGVIVVWARQGGY